MLIFVRILKEERKVFTFSQSPLTFLCCTWTWWNETKETKNIKRNAQARTSICLLSLGNHIFYPFSYGKHNICWKTYEIKTCGDKHINFLKLFFFTAWKISLKACPWTLIFFLHDPSSSTFRKYSQSVSWFGAPNFKASPWSSRPSSFCPSLAREVSLFSTQSYQIIVSFACRPCRAMRTSREMEIQVCNYCKVYSQEIWVIN